jgi:hypothetical protein
MPHDDEDQDFRLISGNRCAQDGSIAKALLLIWHLRRRRKRLGSSFADPFLLAVAREPQSSALGGDKLDEGGSPASTTCDAERSPGGCRKSPGASLCPPPVITGYTHLLTSY